MLVLLLALLAPVDTIPTALAERLDAANRAFSAAFVAGDSATMANSYTADAVLYLPTGAVITGDGRVQRFWRPRAGTKLGHRLEATFRQLLAADVVLEMGRWHDRPNLGSEAKSPWSSGCYTVIWRHGDDGRWRMAYDGWTEPNDDPAMCRPRT
jgi:ketosteroid isomerase-like protein